MKLTNVPAPNAGKVFAGESAPNARLAPASASVVAPDAVQVGGQAERIQAAQVQLAAMPDVDAARVAEIKAALARGEIQFDAQKIAGLVVRHHGGRG